MNPLPRTTTVKPILKIVRSGLAKYLWRLRLAIMKSFLSQSTLRVLLCEVVWGSGGN